MTYITHYLGYKMFAAEQNLYSIIPCLDGYDYIVVQQGNLKIWMKYEDYDAVEEQNIHIDPKYMKCDELRMVPSRKIVI